MRRASRAVSPAFWTKGAVVAGCRAAWLLVVLLVVVVVVVVVVTREPSNSSSSASSPSSSSSTSSSSVVRPPRKSLRQARGWRPVRGAPVSRVATLVVGVTSDERPAGLALALALAVALVQGIGGRRPSGLLDRGGRNGGRASSVHVVGGGTRAGGRGRGRQEGETPHPRARCCYCCCGDDGTLFLHRSRRNRPRGGVSHCRVFPPYDRSCVETLLVAVRERERRRQAVQRRCGLSKHVGERGRGGGGGR